MDARHVLLAAHRNPHGRTADFVCNGLTEEQLRHSAPGHNSVVWLLWHLARSEDVAINTLLRGVPEVIDQEGWLARLGLVVRDIGTGMTDEEVRDVSARVDIPALQAYRAAVGAQTQAWLKTVDFATLDAPLDVAAQLAQAPPALRERAAWVATFWDGQPRVFFLTYTALGHNYWHLGEADHIARLLGRPGR
jgi:hypothetical protein